MLTIGIELALPVEVGAIDVAVAVAELEACGNALTSKL